MKVEERELTGKRLVLDDWYEDLNGCKDCLWICKVLQSVSNMSAEPPKKKRKQTNTEVSQKVMPKVTIPDA